LAQLGRFGCRLWARAFEHQRNSRPAIAGREDRPLRVPTARTRAEFEYLAEQIYAAIRGMGRSTDGEARRLVDDYRKLHQTQAAFARELGITPAARMTIKASSKDSVFDIAVAIAIDGVKEEDGDGR
jgi:hypothetical protein